MCAIDIYDYDGNTLSRRIQRCDCGMGCTGEYFIPLDRVVFPCTTVTMEDLMRVAENIIRILRNNPPRFGE